MKYGSLASDTVRIGKGNCMDVTTGVQQQLRYFSLSKFSGDVQQRRTFESEHPTGCSAYVQRRVSPLDSRVISAQELLDCVGIATDCGDDSRLVILREATGTLQQLDGFIERVLVARICSEQVI